MLKRKSMMIVQVCAVLVVLFSNSIATMAQSEGNNAVAVLDSQGHIKLGAASSYIDAAPFYQSLANLDLCLTLQYILTQSTFTSGSNYAATYPNGAVIDARGILPGSANGLTCNVNPCVGRGGTATSPATILLPGATIAITQPWILPSNTRVIGEGSGPQNYTALGNFGNFSGNQMIQMGIAGTTSPATGVVVEHLQLEGGGKGNYDGIDVVNAADGSYVDDLDIKGIGAQPSFVHLSSVCGTSTATSLCIGPNATYSGPYTNLNIVPSFPCSTQTEVCKQTAGVKIQAQTRGLRNITCVATSHNDSNWPLAAIYLDSYGTSIENVHVEGFKDDIVVGDYSDAQGDLAIIGWTAPTQNPIYSVSGNTIANVVGATGSGPLQNTVHICSPNVASLACSGNGAISGGINDFVVLQAKNGGGASNTEAVQDDNLSVNTSNNGAVVYAGLYAVGRPNTTGGYARFTTMPGNSATAVNPTSAVGAANSLGASCTNYGAIYSNPNGGGEGANTIYVCSGKVWVAIGD